MTILIRVNHKTTYSKMVKLLLWWSTFYVCGSYDPHRCWPYEQNTSKPAWWIMMPNGGNDWNYHYQLWYYRQYSSGMHYLLSITWVIPPIQGSSPVFTTTFGPTMLSVSLVFQQIIIIKLSLTKQCCWLWLVTTPYDCWWIPKKNTYFCSLGNTPI